MTKLLPDADAALADLRLLADGPWREEPEFLELLGSLINDGTPILEIDNVTASGADCSVVRYKLADRLQAFVSARVAVAADADASKVKSSGHGVGPVNEGPSVLDAMAE